MTAPQEPQDRPGPSDSPSGGPGDAPPRPAGAPGAGWAPSAEPARPYPSTPRPAPGEAATTVLPTGGRTAAAGTRDADPRPAGTPLRSSGGYLPPLTPGAAASPRATPPTAPRPAGPGGGAAAAAGTAAAAARPGARELPRTGRGGEARTATARPQTRPAAARSRRARLALKRVDPWSVFVFSLVASVFVAVAVVVAAAALYAALGALGVVDSVNSLFGEVTGADSDQLVLTGGRIIGGAAVLGAVNVVFLTLLATLSALLYNLCASFTGGIEVTLGERD